MHSPQLRDVVTGPAAVLLSLALLAGCGRGGERPASAADTTGAAASVSPDSAAMAAPDTAPAADTAGVKPADTAGKSVSAADTAASRVAARTRSGQARRDTARVQKAESTKSAAVPAPAPTPRQQDTTRAAGQTQDTTKAAGQVQDTTKAAAQAQDTGTAQPQQAEAPLRDAYHQPPRDTVDQAVYDGWKQFNLNCARCHGEDVLGTTIAPHLILSLKPDGPINTKELFMQTVCVGRPEKGMPAWCALGLDMAKINDIYLYVKGRSDAKISPGRPAVKPGS